MLQRAIFHRNLECQVHESRQIGSGQIGDGKSERRYSRNQQLKMDWNEFNSFQLSKFNWLNLTQMTIISTTVGKNPLEEME